MDSRKKVVIVAGESSGDLYGAHLVEAMASLSPQVEFYGIGGSEMERRGVNLLFSSAELAVVGLTEVLEKIGYIWKAWRQMKRFIRDRKPHLAVLIDYPGFNLRLAKVFNDNAVPVLYYVSPQVWAWRPGRIKKIAKRVAKMAVILPFEAALYQQEGVDVEFVGHPLLDILDEGLSREEARRRLGVSTDALLIGLLPGSRGREVKVLLPPLLGAAEILTGDFPLSRFMIPLASTIKRDVVQGIIGRSRLPLEIVEGKTYEVMKAADLLLVVSGTATLEGAIAGAPMVIIYRLSPITYLIGRMLVKVRCIGLANIVVGRKVVPELIQGEVTPQRIALEAKKILRDHAKRAEIKDEFKLITDKLGGKGASQRVARIALQMMGAA
ncbi:MAG: lipid-A-disaccharide synthase [Deltaproteobacteria bacterium RBG_13_52_11]|nr:MAG: lipid-A-disaccharide synthase [Deltaproteobacteria bacterium RBG_13_52_11]